MIIKESLLEAIAITFKRYRKECGLSQQIISDKSELSPNTISDIENGKKCPTIETLFRIFEHMDQDLSKYIEQVIFEYKHIEEMNRKYRENK